MNSKSFSSFIGWCSSTKWFGAIDMIVNEFSQRQKRIRLNSTKWLYSVLKEVYSNYTRQVYRVMQRCLSI